MITTLEILNKVKSLLTSSDIGFDESNVVVVGVPVLLPQFGNETIQLYHSGSSFSMEGGGNFSHRMSFGVRLYKTLGVDAGKSLSATFEWHSSTQMRILRILHLTYDVTDVPLQEPIFAEQASSVRLVQDGDPFFSYSDLGFRVTVTESYEELKQEEGVEVG